MLTITLQEGEYMTIGDDIVVQAARTVEGRCKLNIKAPREVPIVRGEILERSGEERPDCLYETPERSRPRFILNSSKLQTVTAMRRLLYQMDSWDSNVKTLRRQFNYIFPPDLEAGKEEQTTEVSNG